MKRNMSSPTPARLPEWFALSVASLKIHDPNSYSTDDFIEHFLDVHTPNDEFLRETVKSNILGCLHYKKALKVVLDGFYAKDGSRMLKTDEELFLVLTYIIVFNLEEMGFENLKSVLSDMDQKKMHTFLGFLLNEKHLQTWVKDEWMKLYDHQYVKDIMLNPLLEKIPKLSKMVNQIHEKLSKPPKSKDPSPTTEIKPFNLTKPKAKSIPIPEPIPKMKKSKRVPSSTYKQPNESQTILHQKQENRRLAEERLMSSSKQQFSCANSALSAKAKSRKEEIIAEQESKLKFNAAKARDIPKSVLNENIPIRLNAAAILREGLRYKKTEEELINKMRSLQQGAYDSDNFLRWQEEMRARDMAEKEAEIERRRLDGKMSAEDAFLAKQNLILTNKVKVQQTKAETEELMKQYEEERKMQEEQVRLLVANVMSGHTNAKEAKKQLQEQKFLAAQDVVQETQQLLARAMEEAEEEMRQKQELIRQIRALESQPINRFKEVDLTQTAGFGYLGEMSIAELNERLSLLKTTQEKEESERRDQILASKQAKDEMLLETLDRISSHRREQTAAAAIRLENKKKQYKEAQKQVSSQNTHLNDMAALIEEKKKQRKQLQQVSKFAPGTLTAQQLGQLAQNKKYGERSRFLQREKHHERKGLEEIKPNRLGSSKVSRASLLANAY